MLIPDMLLKHSRSDRTTEDQTAVQKVKPRTKRPEKKGEEGRGDRDVRSVRLVHEELFFRRFFRKSMKGGRRRQNEHEQSVIKSKLEVVEMLFFTLSFFLRGLSWEERSDDGWEEGSGGGAMQREGEACE